MKDIFYIFKRQFHLPILKKLDQSLQTVSVTGKMILYSLTALFALSAFALLWNVSNAFMIEVPRPGGKLVEGVVGSPRFINPVLTVTDGDKDLTALIYSGLMRVLPDGTLGKDLAESYSISTDGKMYTFTLRKDAFFHDGRPVTADDVVTTIKKIQDAEIKSPKRAHWEGVVVEKMNDHEVRFILQLPYAPFLENTTIGILPKHIWQELEGEKFITSSYNIKPIGSGPYKLNSIEQTANGIPISYDLHPFEKFYRGKPFISSIVFKFYSTEKTLIEAYHNGEVQSMSSISPDNASILKNESSPIIEASLPRIFAVFFNQANNRALTYKEVRNALSLGVNRDHIVASVLQGFGSALDSAVPKSFTGGVTSEPPTASTTTARVQAIQLLEKNGWHLNAQGIREKTIGKEVIPLAFSISTSDAPELKEVADFIQTEWKAIGADVSVRVVEGGYLNQNIIKPRRYDALLFGQVVNRDLDLYAFWHGSQRVDPGLNVALYENDTVDKLLETMRTETKRETRQELYGKFERELNKDIPAVFLYSPHFIYVVPEDLRGVDIHELSNPSERFSTVNTWYLSTDKMWKIFSPTTYE
ncbi:peptide ABC transporter substrate-binding protein [Candidatus Parcubacteria bacterium]|nr:peptide ABC transporter substrate-binding protein [Candidatus Parcubacteria bacterium]